MAPDIKIERMRLSLIWVESNLGLLGDPEPPQVPKGFLGNRNLYAAEFDRIRKEGSSPDGLTQPWEEPAGHHFWQYYLEKQPLAALDGQIFWKFLIPFRISVPLTITSSWPEGRLTHEGYFYPFGFAWLLTLESKKQMDLKDAIQMVLKSRSLPYVVVLPNWKEKHMGVYALADKCLTWLRESGLGKGASSGSIPTNEPFSVFTVIQGSGTTSAGIPVRGDEIHRALEALTTWNQALISSWGTVQPPPLDSKVLIPLKSGTPQDHVVYAQKRGRAVWFPQAFSDTNTKRCTLSCYHKNLSTAALQVESLCAFLKATASEIKNGRWEYLPVMHHECARIAAGIVGRMYGDVEETYRSLSPRYHMDQNKYVQAINKVRNQVRLKPLEKAAKL